MSQEEYTDEDDEKVLEMLRTNPELRREAVKFMKARATCVEVSQEECAQLMARLTEKGTQ